MSGSGLAVFASSDELVDGERGLAAPGLGGPAVRADDVSQVEVDGPDPFGAQEQLDLPGAVDEVEEDSLPCPRRPSTRPASRRGSGPSWPGSSVSASARTAAASTRPGKRFGSELIEAASLPPP